MVNTDLDMSKYNLHINKQCKSWQDSKAIEVNYDQIKIPLYLGLDCTEFYQFGTKKKIVGKTFLHFVFDYRFINNQLKYLTQILVALK